jgi:hypothetical protein
VRYEPAFFIFYTKLAVKDKQLAAGFTNPSYQCPEFSD